MNGLTSITQKGQVTIPHGIRRILGGKAGDKVKFDLIPGRREARLRIVPRVNITALAGSLKTRVREVNHSLARNVAGKLLARYYRVK